MSYSYAINGKKYGGEEINLVKIKDEKKRYDKNSVNNVQTLVLFEI